MSDEPVSHEDIERWVDKQARDLLNRLPDNIESREAKRLHEIVVDLAHDAREKPAQPRG